MMIAFFPENKLLLKDRHIKHIVTLFIMKYYILLAKKFIHTIFLKGS